MTAVRNRVRLALLALAATLSLAGALLWITAPSPEASTAAVSDADGQPAAVRVAALRATRRPVREEVLLSGVVEPIRRVTLTAEVDGRIVALGAREHEAVRAGQEIATLDDTLRRAALERAEAVVLRATASHRLAELEFERRRNLSKDGLVSPAELDVAASRERETYGALAEARALRDEAREILARTVIHAPFDGLLTNFNLEVGDRMQPGGRIGEIIDISSVEVELGVNEIQVGALHPGARVAIRVSVHPERAFPATVRDVGTAIRPETRKFPIEIVAANPQRLLLPGMVADVRVALGSAEPRIRIPRQATVSEFGLTYVFALDTGRNPAIATRRRVKVRSVAFRPAELEVIDGLEEGESIAAGNLRDLRDGVPVVVEDYP